MHHAFLSTSEDIENVISHIAVYGLKFAQVIYKKNLLETYNYLINM